MPVHKKSNGEGAGYRVVMGSHSYLPPLHVLYPQGQSHVW